MLRNKRVLRSDRRASYHWPTWHIARANKRFERSSATQDSLKKFSRDRRSAEAPWDQFNTLPAGFTKAVPPNSLSDFDKLLSCEIPAELMDWLNSSAVSGRNIRNGG